MLLLDLYAALRPIDAITGATTAEDILNRIFSTFCIGKYSASGLFRSCIVKKSTTRPHATSGPRLSLLRILLIESGARRLVEVFAAP